VAGTPLWLQSVPGAGGTATAAAATASVVTAAVLPHARSAALGISGVVFQLAGSAPASGKVRVGFDYSSFAQAYGGNYGTRLRLVELPACALTTPQVAACRKQAPVPYTQDYKRSTVAAVVGLGSAGAGSVQSQAAGAAPVRGGLLLAATSATGSGGGAAGAYPPTKLTPDGTWSEGGDTGAFTYSYPVTIPVARGGLTPPLTLGYDSQSVDGKTATTQAQSNWLGDGWSTPDSNVTLQTTSCADHPEGTAANYPTGDSCYAGKLVQLSLDGTDTPLVFSSSATSGGVTTSTWKAQTDGGAVITHVSPSGSVFAAYDKDNPGQDYWTVTKPDGTEYWFGLQHLPGWASGDAATNSVDWMPVESGHSGDPCYNANSGQTGFAASVCTMAYEWHLDYVKDVHSDAMAYYYTQATNYYGENGGASNVAYISDSYVDHIAYGFTDGNAYSTTAPPADLVTFSAQPRCTVKTAGTCGALSTSNPNVSTQYPDVPVDLLCAQGATCTAFSPATFSQVRLDSITTEQYSPALGAYQDVDSYQFTQEEPASGDGLAATLWLDSITRTGQDAGGGGTQANVPLPAVSFGKIDLQNRLSAATYPGLYRYRMASVTNETGGDVDVSYGNPDPCPASYSPSSDSSVTSSNADSCFPVYWSPSGAGTPALDWFQSYAVTKVVTGDTTGGAVNQETDYSYGKAAWHYDDNFAVEPKYQSWGQFRGYSTVTTETGQTTSNPQTKTVTAYYQGMDGDILPAGTRSIVLQDSAGGSHTDSDQLAGQPLQVTTYQGAGGPEVSSTITSYWVSAATATMDPTTLPALKSDDFLLSALNSGTVTLPNLIATRTQPAEGWTETALTDGGTTSWRDTETDYTYDTTTTDANFGQLAYTYFHTDPVNTAYDSCTTNQYAPANASMNLVGLISYAETDQAACSGYTAGAHPSAPAALNALSAPPAGSITSAQISKATETFYEHTASGTSFATTFPQASAPVNSDVTMTRQATGGTPDSPANLTWQVSTQVAYDTYGRVTDSYDQLGRDATTSYTDNADGETTGFSAAAPPTTYAGSSGTVTTTHVTSQTLDPARALPLTSTDQNGVVTTEQYDELGRLTSVWTNGRQPGTTTANVTYAYYLPTATNKLSGVVTETLNAEGNQVPSATIYDSLGRVRQTQALGTTSNGDGRVVTDTLYDSRGWVSEVSHGTFDSTSLPALTLYPTTLSTALDIDQYTYDGAGRQVEDTSVSNSHAIATTVTVYNGDSTTVIPGIPAASVATGAIPATAGTVQTTAVNALGQVTSLTQYTANPTLNVPSNTTTGTFYLTTNSGTPSTTTYGYDAMGNQVQEALGGATWKQQYDLLGRQTSSTDATGGTTAMSYDADGNLTQSQDPAGAFLSWTYDEDGRKTAQYTAASNAQHAFGTTGANQVAAWVYDDANGAAGSSADAKGQLSTVTSYANGHAYVKQQNGFNVFGESTGEKFTFDSTAPGAGLGTPSSSGTTTSLNFINIYEPINGELTKQVLPAAGGLPAETVTYSTVGALDLPGITGGNNGYAAAATYTDLSQPEQVTLGSGSNEATVTYAYDPRTGALTDAAVKKAGNTAVDEVSYGYSPAGAQTSESDERNGSASMSELQCFAYTTNGQLAQAWTASSSCSTVPTKSSHSTVGDGLGTTSEYDEIWAYTALGEPHTEDSLVPSANAYATTTYGYSKSTEVTSTSTAGAATGAASYTYNADGQEATRSPNSGQTLAWNGQGDLAGVTKTTGGATVAGYVYDADGNLFTQTEGTKTTVYLPGEQLSIDTSTSPATLSGVRFYSLPGGITAVRTGSGTAYGFELASDQHGTNTLYLDSTAQNATWRQFDPYGNPRGTAPASGFPGSRGFLNDPVDASTSLTNIGARWYDPATGTFASLDPVLDKASPLLLNGYTYAGANPVGSSDPTGQQQIGCNGPCPAPPRTDGGQPISRGTFDTSSGNTTPSTVSYQLGPSIAFGSPSALKKDFAQTAAWFDRTLSPGTGECDLPYGPVKCDGTGQLVTCFTYGSDCAIGSYGLLEQWFFAHLCSLGGVEGCVIMYDAHALSVLRAPGFSDAGPAILPERGGSEEGLGDAGGACMSFTPDTGVLLADGKAAPIATLKPGDAVLATNTKTGKTSLETVTAVEVHHDTDLYDLHVKTGHGVAVLHTTSNHLFWDPVARAWVKAGDLKPGEPLRSPDGAPAAADGGSVPAAHDGWMWDLTVPGDNDHDFYVAVADGSGRAAYRVARTGETYIHVHNTGSPNCNLSPGNSTGAAKGTEVHNGPEWEYQLDSLGYTGSKPIDSKNIPDGFTANGYPVELKPDTPSGIKAGTRRLRRYMSAMPPGMDDYSELWVYSFGANGEVNFRLAAVPNEQRPGRWTYG
jgi:RHS repeat-associated protein